MFPPSERSELGGSTGVTLAKEGGGRTRHVVQARTREGGRRTRHVVPARIITPPTIRLMARDLVVRALQGYPADIGAALWMMEDARSRTLRAVEGLAESHVDVEAAGATNTIGALLYHIALVEADWLYEDILRVEFPSWMHEVFPYESREEDGRLTRIPAMSLTEHLQRLELVRKNFLEDIKAVDAEDFRTTRESESGVLTPQWVFHHLGQHEGEHRGQIQTIRTILEG